MAAHDIPSPEASINTDAALKPGQYQVIRCDGTETIHPGKISPAEIQRIIGCDGFDTVTIDRRKQTVMFVDDTGRIDKKPIYPKATAPYHAQWLPGNPCSINGDVVIVPAGGLA